MGGARDGVVLSSASTASQCPKSALFLFLISRALLPVHLVRSCTAAHFLHPLRRAFCALLCCVTLLPLSEVCPGSCLTPLFRDAPLSSQRLLPYLPCVLSQQTHFLALSRVTTCFCSDAHICYSFSLLRVLLRRGGRRPLLVPAP